MFTPDVIKTIVWALAMIIVLTIFILIFKKQLASRMQNPVQSIHQFQPMVSTNSGAWYPTNPA